MFSSSVRPAHYIFDRCRVSSGSPYSSEVWPRKGQPRGYTSLTVAATTILEDYQLGSSENRAEAGDPNEFSFDDETEASAYADADNTVSNVDTRAPLFGEHLLQAINRSIFIPVRSPPTYNDARKLQAKSQRCGSKYEVKYGLRTHMKRCTSDTPRRNASSGASEEEEDGEGL